MGDWSDIEQACLELAKPTLELCESHGAGMPVVLVAQRDTTRAYIYADARTMWQLGELVVAGLSATCVSMAFNTWHAQVPEDIGHDDLDLDDLALNQGWLEAGLIRECLTIATGERTGGLRMVSQFYSLRPDRSVLWLQAEHADASDTKGSVIRWIRETFTHETYAQAQAKRGEPPMDERTRAMTDEALMHFLATKYDADMVLSHV